MISFPTWLSRKTIAQKAAEELEQAERDLMEAEASIEAAEAVQQMLIRRIARLQEYLGNSADETIEIRDTREASTIIN